MKQLGLSLGGAIRSFERARYTRRQQQAMQLELALKEIMDPRDAVRLAGEFANRVAPPSKPEETFIMLHASQNAAVNRWLEEHSKRPMKAMRLWSELFTAVHSGTGEVLLSRADLAARTGIEPRTVSELMTELAGVNAIVRRKEGRKVRYFMNPNVATHIPSPEARKAARDAAGPLLVLMEGGRSDAR
jgi:DNA-binding transcriptional ArsR family regulator